MTIKHRYKAVRAKLTERIALTRADRIHQRMLYEYHVAQAARIRELERMR